MTYLDGERLRDLINRSVKPPEYVVPAGGAPLGSRRLRRLRHEYVLMPEGDVRPAGFFEMIRSAEEPRALGRGSSTSSSARTTELDP